jgi:UTP-glucose-1-phosphate uridylyltransferase
MAAERIYMYGVVGIGERRDGLFSITGTVEKAARKKAPSNLIMSGCQILRRAS